LDILLSAQGLPSFTPFHAATPTIDRQLNIELYRV
jgi:hypothetical protein